MGREEVPGRVDLTLVVSNRTLSASYRLTLPPAQPLFKATQQGDASAGGLARLLGRIQGGGQGEGVGGRGAEEPRRGCRWGGHTAEPAVTARSPALQGHGLATRPFLLPAADSC